MSESALQLELKYQELAELTKLVLDAEARLESAQADVQQKLTTRFEELAAMTRLLLDQERDELRLGAQFAMVLKYLRTRKSIWGRMIEALQLLSIVNLRYVGLWSERRRTLQTGMFDTEWYGRTYPDVKKSGMDPVYHYLAYGFREGRNPNPLFSTAYYLNQLGASRAGVTNPLLHYSEQLLARAG